MKLRYHTIQSKVNAEEVKLFAHTNQLTLMDAKRRLEDKTTTVLQYLPDGGTAQDWIDVPYVVEYR